LVIVLFAGMTPVRSAIRAFQKSQGVVAASPFEALDPGEFVGTVFLGGFRGFLLDFLWMRAYTLQQRERYFELLTLYELIAKLQPYYETVWIYNSWNMTHNISHDAEELSGKWAWVKKGIAFLEKGARNNPRSYKIYDEMGRLHYHRFDKRYFPGEYQHFRKWFKEENGGLEPQLKAIEYYRRMYALVPKELSTRMTRRHRVAHCYYSLAGLADLDSVQEDVSPAEREKARALSVQYRRLCLAEWKW
jgi:tetratricopeptide (TPR) repeat protein